MNEQRYLTDTRLLNFHAPNITALVTERGWESLSEYDKIGSAYHFVKDEILFGYNAGDERRASDILNDGYGQCNTKGILLMALLRRLGVPCRWHGFTIDNALQKGAIPAFLIPFAPKYIIHSWVEVFTQGRWIELEGFIIDDTMLASVQATFPTQTGAFCGYGIATPCLSAPKVEWRGQSTYIQREGIHDDFGLFDSPDQFYNTHGSNLSGCKKLLYQYVIRHLINLNVRRLRRRHPPIDQQSS